MVDHSDYCTCSPIIEMPTRDDLLHPHSHITPEEMLKYRTMQRFGNAKCEEISSSEKLPSQKYSELDKTKNQHFKCAEAANYKLIEVTNYNTFLCRWVWYHCVFKAAPETSSTPELFFAELHGFGWNKYHVITVTQVVNVDESYDCWYCMGKNMPHPVLTLSRDSDLLFSEGMIDIGPPRQFQEDYELLKGYYDVQHNRQRVSSNLHKASHLEPFSRTSEIKYEPSVHSVQFSEAAINNTINAKHEGHGKMRYDFESSQREVYVIDGNNTQICEDAQQTIATDAAPSHSPILPLVAGHVKKIIQSIEYNIMRDRDSDYSSAIKGHYYDASGNWSWC